MSKFFASVLAIFICFTSYGQIRLSGDGDLNPQTPKTYEIGGITVEGSKVLDVNALILLSGLSVGDKIIIPGDATTKAIKNLWAQGLFSDVEISYSRIQGDKIFLTIQITERPRLSKFKFEGIRKSEAEDLREELNLFREKILTNNLLVSTQRKVEKYFIDKGFLNVSVNLQTDNDTTYANHTVLIIDVKKNNKVKIKKITIQGNQALSDLKVKGQLKETKEKSVFKPFVDFDGMLLASAKGFINHGRQKGFSEIIEYFGNHVKIRLFKASKFIESNFEDDKAKLIARYNKKGYRDAQIVADSVFKNNDKTISINLKIEEGPQYYFGNISFVGNKKYTSKFLSSMLGVKRGDIYDPERLDQNLYMDQNGKDISSLYMDDGYLFFQIQPVEVSIVGDTIDLEIQIYEGQQARINKIIISGNTKTNDHVIIREMRTKPGQLFSRSDIIRSQRELSVLGYFDAEQLKVNPIPNQADGTVDIEYQVVESPSDQIELSGGFGGGFVVGTLGVTFNNFSSSTLFKKGAWRPVPSGDGQRLSIRAQSNGFFFQSYNMSFTEPWLGGRKPNAFTISAYQSRQSNARKFLQDSTGVDGKKVLNPNRAYVIISGISVGLGKRLKWPDDYFILQNEISYQNYSLQNWSQFLFSTGKANNMFYRVSFSRNSVDQAIYPRLGSEFKATFQTTIPYSYFNNKDYDNLAAIENQKAIENGEELTASQLFDRVQQEKYRWVEYYKWKFTTNTYTTLIGNLVLNTKVGFGFLGTWNQKVGAAPFERFYLGGSGLTGFALDGREIIALRGYNDQSVSPTVGGTIISKYTAELRYPFTLNPSATIFGLVFAEAGNTWNNFNTYNPFDVKRSAGVGVRIFLPMFGLLGLDWGRRFDEVPGFPNMQRSQIHFTIGANLGDL